MSSRGLGRGIDSLLPKDLNIDNLVPGISVRHIKLNNIKPNPKQPRRKILDEELDELVGSIKNYGVLQPILLIESGSGYMIVAGERRFRAAQKAKLSTIPAIIKTLDELQVLQVALTENVQRQDLNPIEQAASIKRLHDDFGKTYEQIAKELNRSASSIINSVRLLDVPEQMQAAISEGLISEGHARALLALKSQPRDQQTLFDNIINHGWSVRRSEQFVKEAKAADRTNTNNVQRNQNYIEDQWTKQLSRKINSRVVINPTAKGGYLKIDFKTKEDLERIKDLFNNL